MHACTNNVAVIHSYTPNKTDDGLGSTAASDRTVGKRLAWRQRLRKLGSGVRVMRVRSFKSGARNLTGTSPHLNCKARLSCLSPAQEMMSVISDIIPFFSLTPWSYLKGAVSGSQI